MSSVDPLRITVDDERQAVALARELIGVWDLDVYPECDRWVVSLGAGLSDNLVARVLDAVSRSLAGEPTASALVTLDDREYHMRGALVTTTRKREWGGSNTAYGIRTERSGEQIFVVSLAGEHDLHTAPKVQEALCSAVAVGARTTVVDLTETTFLDSTILHVLLSARKEVRDGGHLRIVTRDPKLKRVFEITGFDRFFDFYPSRRAAEEEVRSA